MTRIERDVEDMDVDEIAKELVDELKICDVCGRENNGFDQLDVHHTESWPVIAVKFDCEACGGHNEHVAEIQ